MSRQKADFGPGSNRVLFVAFVVLAGLGDGSRDHVVDGAQGEGIVEDIAEQFVDAA